MNRFMKRTIIFLDNRIVDLWFRFKEVLIDR